MKVEVEEEEEERERERDPSMSFVIDKRRAQVHLLIECDIRRG